MTPQVMEQLIANNNASQPPGTPPFKWKTIPQGAATTVWAGIVADPNAVGGHYCEDCHVAVVVENQTTARGGVRRYALDLEHARALWAKSEQLVGERFQ